jgi:hypothetical protein
MMIMGARRFLRWGARECGIRAGNLDTFMYHARYVVEVGLLRCGGRRMGYCLFVCFVVSRFTDGDCM